MVHVAYSCEMFTFIHRFDLGEQESRFNEVDEAGRVLARR